MNETARERLLRLLADNPDPAFAQSDAHLRGWAQGLTEGAAVTDEPFTYPSCAHCGLEIENRGDPNPFGPWGSAGSTSTAGTASATRSSPAAPAPNRPRDWFPSRPARRFAAVWGLPT